MKLSDLRFAATVVLVISLFGCTPAPDLTTVSPAPTTELSPTPEPTPMPLGVPQTARLRYTSLSITPVQVEAKLLSSQQGPSSEVFYVAIRFQISNLGPERWTPFDRISIDQPGICLDLGVPGDLENPLCGNSYGSPQLSLTTGEWMKCGPRFGDDPLWWQRTPDLSLIPSLTLAPGESRDGWFTWCVAEEFGSVNLAKFQDGLVLRVIRVFGWPVEWSIPLYP
jgi:hypothetical protein